jgi:serine/threonine-protein kinase
MNKKVQKITLAITVVTILAFMALSYSQIKVLEILDRELYDVELPFSLKEQDQIPPIALIAIDEMSLQKQGPWPWPRNVIARIIDRVAENEPGVIGCYLPFFTKEYTHGLSEVQDFEQKLKFHPLAKKAGDFRVWIQQNIDQMEERLNHDAVMAGSIGKSSQVILPFKVYFDESSVTKKQTYPFLADKFLSSKNPLKDYKVLPVATSLMPPIPEFSNVALGLGHNRFQSFHDALGPRSHPVYVSYSDGLLPSFPLAVLIHYYHLKSKQVFVQEDQFQIKDNLFPLTDGEMLFRFRDNSSTFSLISSSDLLSDKKEFSLKNKIVLIGLNTPDYRTVETPIGRISEVELSAHILASILNNQIISRPWFINYVELFLILALGLFSYLLYSRYGNNIRILWIFVLIILVLASGFILLAMMNIWLKTGTLAISILALFVIYGFINLVFSGTISKESIETNRLLGLSFQSQGLLDLAFEKFQTIPLNNDSKDLLYNLGLEYEKKRMINKALSVYEYINKDGSFRDLSDRIPKLRESEKSSTLGSHSLSKEGSILTDSSADGRSKVGRYEIIEELGKGSMGLVYKALDPKINRVVAIKTIRFSDEFEDDVINEIKERFFREAEIAGQLSHPSIVTIHDVGEDLDLTYMAMEFLEGDDLEKFTVKGNLLSIRRALDVTSQVADALSFAHQSEVIHRDIKPANIMILKNGRVKVTDFGIAKAISSSRTRTGVILGTPNYMSPEQIMGQKIDPRSDTFSLGVLFFQLLTGELPFHGENLSSLLYQITQVRHPSVREKNQKIPRACEQIIDKAMAKNPKDRFSKASEMSKVLKMLSSKMDALMKKKQAPGNT